MKKLLLTALTVAAVLVAEKARAQDERKTNQERVENTKADIRRGSREVKEEVKEASREVSNDTKRAGRKLKRSAKKTTGDAAEGVEKGARKVKNDVRDEPN